MHPEQAPGPDDAPKHATQGTPRAARGDIISAGGDTGDPRGEPPRDQRGELPRNQHDSPPRDEQAASAPRDPEENPQLHTGDNITPVDRSMIESLGGTAPPDTHHTSEIEPAPADTIAPANSSADASADARDGIAPAPAPAKRRRRRGSSDLRPCICPPFPLSPLAEKLWNRLFMSSPHLWLIASYFKAARYCTLFAMWIEISQVLSTKGMIYVRHAKDNARVDAIRIMPHFQYLMRLEYALESLERELGIDARGDAGRYAEFMERVREDSDDEA
ncbi:MAG: hypothetical protein JNL50_09130 [Phycisphaerae bacterium]|nr:hypothetical protein [Phycisphaerae bacterium]